MDDPVFLVNGRRSGSLPVQDRAVQYGDGVFETLAVFNGAALCWDRHLKRLNLGCQRLGIPAPAPEELAAQAATLIPQGGAGVLKILVSRGVSGRGYTPPPNPAATRVLQWFPGPLSGLEHRRDGIEAKICNTRLGHSPLLAGIKHLNRLEQVLARMELTGTEQPEAVMLDLDGRPVAGTMSNLFLIRGARLVTPDVSRCGVAGVIREIILERAGDWGLQPDVRAVDLDEIHSADELFFTNSVIGVWPARRVGERRLSATDQGRRILADLIAAGQVRAA